MESYKIITFKRLLSNLVKVFRNITYLGVSTLKEDNSRNKIDLLTIANEKSLDQFKFVIDKISC